MVRRLRRPLRAMKRSQGFDFDFVWADKICMRMNELEGRFRVDKEGGTASQKIGGRAKKS